MSDDLTVDGEGTATPSGMDRRTFVRRAAVTGALAWAAPSITSMPAAFAAQGGSAFCRTTIDAFTVRQFLDTDGSTAFLSSGTVPAGPAAGDPSILGGYRTAEVVEVTSSTSGGVAVLDIGNGTLRLDAGSGVKSKGTITWDSDGVGLGGVDLTDGGADLFRLEFQEFVYGTVDFTLTVSDGGNTQSSTRDATGPADGTVPEALEFPFGDFTPVNLAQVTSLSLVVAPRDITVDLVTFAFKVCYIN